jgi:hypothetical protein
MSATDGGRVEEAVGRYLRLGFEIPVGTLVDQVRWSTDLLRPLWRAAVAGCIASKVMHLDATGLAVLDRAARGGKRIGSLWGYVGDDVCAYVYASTGQAGRQVRGDPRRRGDGRDRAEPRDAVSARATPQLCGSAFDAHGVTWAKYTGEESNAEKAESLRQFLAREASF